VRAERAHADHDPGAHDPPPKGVFGRTWMRLYGRVPLAGKRSKCARIASRSLT